MSEYVEFDLCVSVQGPGFPVGTKQKGKGQILHTIVKGDTNQMWYGVYQKEEDVK